MMILISCTECGKSGRLPFELRWEYEERCKKCCTYDTKVYNFCSEQCMFRFVEKFVGHSHDWKWDYRFDVFSERDLRAKVEEPQTCKICGLRQWKERKK